jgi:BirA family biotin operon repressor/biotin-[acetyl-CoA-carboxylase] ligase
VGFDVERFRALARERRLPLGAPLVAMTETSSTNDDAMRAARGGALHGATFIAETQHAGRGRRGARWASRPGENLTFSVVLRIALAPDRVAALPLAAGLAVRHAAAERVDSSVLVKWPNDVLARRKKLAGVLVESQIVDRRVEAVVIGIGLNVSMRELPDEIRESATSLALLGARDLCRESLLADVLAALDERVRRFVEAGPAGILGELRAHDALKDRRVVFDGVAGIARGIADDGALLVETDSGTTERVVSGAVEVE